jgi:hypothetical protein
MRHIRFRITVLALSQPDAANPDNGNSYFLFSFPRLNETGKTVSGLVNEGKKRQKQHNLPLLLP